MSSVRSEEQRPVQAQIEQAHERLSGLEQDLRELDREMEELLVRSAHYELLDQICGNLDQLRDIGAEELFWGPRIGEAQASDHLRDVRARIENFQHERESIQSQRDALLEGIKSGQEVLDILEDDLLEILIAEEEKEAEWLIERELDESADRALVMPWTRRGEDDRRFRKTLAMSLAICLLLGLIIPLIDIPILQRDEVFEVPERFAELIREEERPLPPVEPEPEEIQPEAEEPEVVPEEEEPVVAEETPPEEAPVAEEPAPAVAQEEAPVEERARSTGILAFRESFSNLASSRPSAQLGAAAQINDAGEAAVGRTERSMVTTQGPGSSGGINLSSLSRDVGGGGTGGDQIGGVQVTRVASSIGGTGTGDRPLASGAVAGRTDEEIQIVFDRYKAALYRLYNRELRNDPTLRGQMVLRLTIEPDGSVSFCELQSSDMGAPTLEQQVVDRVLTMDFGAKDGIPAITILYPIDFLPAA